MRAAQFGIARITLRAALRSLKTVGYLVIKIGSKGGAWINDAATLRKRWEERMIADRHEVDETLEFRRLTETRIAYLAAERRTEEELQLLESLACRHRRTSARSINGTWGSTTRWQKLPTTASFSRPCRASVMSCSCLETGP